MCTFSQFSLSFLSLEINQRDAPSICVRTLRSLNPFLISHSLSLSLSLVLCCHNLLVTLFNLPLLSL